jgi:cobalt/nickel transport system ATP-binding protein
MTAPALRLTDVGYVYPDGAVALSDISFAVAPGEKVGIVGPNGAGKSTLLLLLNGVLLPQHGRVEVDGVAVGKKTLRRVRRTIGVVFQNPDDQLFCPTVFEDVAFGPRNMDVPEAEVAERVAAALDLVGMGDFGQRSAHHLSFGQKKRVALATVLSMRPAIWAFDEPSANLDPHSQQAIETFIAGCPDTVVVVTQDLAFAAETCDRLIVLFEGRVVRDAPLAEIVAAAEEMKRYHLDFERHCRACASIRRVQE